MSIPRPSRRSSDANAKKAQRNERNREQVARSRTHTAEGRRVVRVRVEDEERFLKFLARTGRTSAITQEWPKYAIDEAVFAEYIQSAERGGSGM